MLEIRYCTNPECCPTTVTCPTTELICSRHALRWEIEGDGEVVSRPCLPCQDSCKAHLVTPERWAEIDA